MFISFCIVWTIKLSRRFSELIGMKLDHTSKREIVFDDIIYMFANLQKFWS
jgi:hypothetical protein